MYDFWIRQRNGKSRLVTGVPNEWEKPRADALAAELKPLVERQLPDTVHGWRKGGSVQRAIRDIHHHRGERIACDIESYFPSIDQDRLAHRVNRLDPTLWPRLKRFLGSSGIPHGCAFSPALGNLFLTDIDRRFPLIRYCDNLMIVAPDAPRQLIRLERHLKDIGLNVHSVEANPTCFCKTPL